MDRASCGAVATRWYRERIQFGSVEERSLDCVPRPSRIEGKGKDAGLRSG
jgi:hypothetical protein